MNQTNSYLSPPPITRLGPGDIDVPGAGPDEPIDLDAEELEAMESHYITKLAERHPKAIERIFDQLCACDGDPFASHWREMITAAYSGDGIEALRVLRTVLLPFLKSAARADVEHIRAIRDSDERIRANRDFNARR